MARIRTIKPEFWTDDAVTECSLSARLLFIGIWNFADDAGNLDRSAKQIKSRVFPIDNVDCEPLIVELITQGLLTEYAVSGKKYLHIPGFTKHQVINRPSKPVVPAYESSLSDHVTLTESSVVTHDGREGKGRERKGGEGKHPPNPPEAGGVRACVELPGSDAWRDVTECDPQAYESWLAWRASEHDPVPPFVRLQHAKFLAGKGSAEKQRAFIAELIQRQFKRLHDPRQHGNPNGHAQEQPAGRTWQPDDDEESAHASG